MKNYARWNKRSPTISGKKACGFGAISLYSFDLEKELENRTRRSTQQERRNDELRELEAEIAALKRPATWHRRALGLSFALHASSYSPSSFFMKLTKTCLYFIMAWATLALLLAGCSQESINPLSPEDGTSPTGLDSFAQNARLGRGMNLGNALEAPNEGEWSVTLKSEYFDLIKNAGFTSVRIPIRWSAHAAASAPYSIANSFLQRVDWAIDQALARKLAVVINIHHYDEIMLAPAAHKARFLALWQQLATHYKNYSGDLFFELLNEPNTSLTIDLWNQYLHEAIAAIRQTNPGRTIIVGPANWYYIGLLNTLALPANDRNLIVAFHYYNPFQFTHQGAEWVPGSNTWLGTRWTGTAAERQAIQQEFAAAVQWGAANNRPLNLGEFGAYSKADMASRALWTEFVARTAEANGVSWHYWEFIAGFGVYNGATNDWNYPLLNALIPNARSYAFRR